ncbi:hypothetical protein [Anaerotignum sp.]
MSILGRIASSISSALRNKSSSSSKSSSKSSSSSSSSSNKNYDPNKDYAAAIKTETDPNKRAQLIQERQNKIDAMNAAGTNTNGYTNDIYNSGGSNNSGSSSKSGTSGNSSGYFDPNKDYAAAIAAETDPAKRAQLIQERQNKIDAMNAAGTNTKGYTNDIYNTPSSAPKGIYQSKDSVLNNTALGKAQMDETQNAALAAMQARTAEGTQPQTAYGQTALGEADPIQQAALQAYITRQYAHQNAEGGEGTYNGDQSMSLPDQKLLQGYQAAWNQAKERGDQAGMDAAHQAAEALRNNYRYYPLANSNGYGLGENNIGFIRDIVVRGDQLGNKYIDQYNRGTVTTTTYDKDGNFVNRYTGGNIAKHDARVAEEMQRTNESLANAGKENNTFAVRLSDPNDVKLTNAQLLAKYGGGITAGNNGIGLYTAPTGTAAQSGGNGAGGGSPAATSAGTAQNGTSIGYFDPNKDYAAAIANAGSTQEMLQLQQERQNKINWMNANGQNPNGYTNQIYGNYQNLTAPQTAQQIPTYQGMTRDELFDGYNDMAESLEEQRTALLKATLAQNQAAQETAEQEFDDIARQAYILRRQQELALPQQLAALGISGGASETANLQLATNYQNNLNSNEQARQQMLKDYALQALQAQTQANSDISGYYADAQQQAMNAWQNERANRNSWNQWAAGFQQQLNEYQNSLNQQTYNEILANRQYENELKQQQLNLALQMGDYNKLAALGYDSSYLKRMQDAELEQMALEAALTRANIAKVNRSVTKGSGGGKKSVINEEDDNPPTPDLTITNQDNGAAIYVPGLRWVSYSDLDKMIDAGTVKEEVNGSKLTYKKVW